MDADTIDARGLDNAIHGLKLTCINLPWLSGLAQAVRVEVDNRVSVAAVTQSGRILINSGVFSDLPLGDATFVMAHELLHLAFDTFRRSSIKEDREMVNRAHDYIINGILGRDLCSRPPLGGLDWRGAADCSLELMIKWMKDADEPSRNLPCWSPESIWLDESTSGSLGDVMRAAGLVPDSVQRRIESEALLKRSDMIFPELEAELFPAAEKQSVKAMRSFQQVIQRTLASQAVVTQLELRNSKRSNMEPMQDLVQRLDGLYFTPWESALQRWMEGVAPGRRSYSRPSRRGGTAGEWVRPGRLREGWTLHVVLDTSGSMINVLPDALGSISHFAVSVGVVDVHIVQCDNQVTVDQWVPAEELDSFSIEGFGGSDMTPGMARIDEDEEATAMVVITDGEIDYPTMPPRCSVVWVLLSDDNHDFRPPYGEALFLNTQETQ